MIRQNIFLYFKESYCYNKFCLTKGILLRRPFLVLTVIVLTLCPSGCTTLKVQHFVTSSPRPAQDQQFFSVLDKIVHKYGVREASNFALKQFPYLRANLFLAALKDRAATDIQKEQWAEWMRKTDLEARTKEINNLPFAALKELSKKLKLPLERAALNQKLSKVSQEMFTHDKTRPGFYDTLKAVLAQPPSEYSTLKRIAGLCPLFTVPIVAGTNAARKEFKDWHKRSKKEIKVLGTLNTYVPPPSGDFTTLDLSLMFNATKRDALGVPLLTDDEIKRLAQALAPVFVQDTVGNYDHFGEVIWDQGHVSINTDKPVVYYYPSYAFIKNAPVVQINYAIWYTKRSGPNAPWLERGSLDGLTLRITLSPLGEPIMLDIMNSCGCYHFYVPRAEKVSKITEKPLVVDELPKKFPMERLSFRIKTGWHQVEHTDTSADINIKESKTYALIPYDVLESLPNSDGQNESVFNPYGIMKGSHRIESYVLFSSGISSIGSMRQRGHHAISMLEREDFSDPDIFDKNFTFK